MSSNYDNKVIVTEYNGYEAAFSYTGNECKDLILYKAARINVNDIYIGRVSNVKKDLDACFVNIQDDITGFLPFSDINGDFLVNRSFDGSLKQGDIICVQVCKDRIKTKEYGLTMNISIPGLYSVVITDDKKIHYSGKLNKNDINRFINLLSDTSFDFGAIIRTNAVSASDSELINEIKTNSDILSDLLNVFKTRSLYTCLYKGKSLLYERISSIKHVSKVITDSDYLYKELEGLCNLELYTDSFPLKALFSFDKAFSEATDKKVYLKSGGYLIIDQTETLTVIDVNSGKNDRKVSKEELIKQTNREAAVEIVRQLRLRNISGIIIVDFINMNHTGDKDELISLVKKGLSQDLYKAAFIDITPLGLMEITREKRYPSLKDIMK